MTKFMAEALYIHFTAAKVSKFHFCHHILPPQVPPATMNLLGETCSSNVSNLSL